MVIKGKRTKKKGQGTTPLAETKNPPEKVEVEATLGSESAKEANSQPETNPGVSDLESAKPQIPEKTEDEKPQAAAKPAVAAADEPINEKEEIIKLLDEGYSVKQIIDLGFNRRTVYHYAKQQMKPENLSAPANEQPNGTGGRVRQEIIKLGAKDTIPPEAVLEVIHLPQNGDAVEVWRRGVLDGVGMLLLGARYAQLTAAGQAEIVKSQLDVMQEAKDSGRDIAQEAAQQTAMQMANYIDERFPRTEPKTVEKTGDAKIAGKMFGPIADMFGKQMASVLARSFGGMLGGQPAQDIQSQVPEGWQFKKEGGE